MNNCNCEVHQWKFLVNISKSSSLCYDTRKHLPFPTHTQTERFVFYLNCHFQEWFSFFMLLNQIVTLHVVCAQSGGVKATGH